jgi:hypothetical protein
MSFDFICQRHCRSIYYCRDKVPRSMTFGKPARAYVYISTIIFSLILSAVELLKPRRMSFDFICQRHCRSIYYCRDKVPRSTTSGKPARAYVYISTIIFSLICVSSGGTQATSATTYVNWLHMLVALSLNFVLQG